MKSIRQRLCLFGVFTGLGLAAAIVLLFIGVSCLISGLPAIFWIKEHRSLKTAKLILENCIVHIRSAVIKEKAYVEEDYECVEGIEVFISNFGVLLDSKIINFNQGGVRLKAVEIGRNYISLAYGTEKRMRKIWLLSYSFGEDELADIVGKFRYETGVVPDCRGYCS